MSFIFLARNGFEVVHEWFCLDNHKGDKSAIKLIYYWDQVPYQKIVQWRRGKTVFFLDNF